MTRTLDVTQKQDVAYAIPLWLRDQQIAYANTRVKARLEPAYAERPEKIAVVCYGPSLNDTWEAIRDFPVVMTCSGSHKYLTDRGIFPNYHVEVDPRPHKVQLIGTPVIGCTYLIASTCHKAVFDHLEGMDVRLWHVFDSQEEGKRVLPYGEWAIFGGCNVGLRAMALAAFLGFRDVHVFGMDGCEGQSGKHAAEHPNQPKGSADVEYPPGSGVFYKTTPAMLEAARGTWHELNQMPQVAATFHGEGLVQAMAKDYKPQVNPMSGMLGYRKMPVISEEYRSLNRQLHETNAAYGVGGAKHAKTVLSLVEQTKARSVLDYGCGKGELGKALPFGICEYDPAIPGKEASPRPADLVICTDVLEHIEPDMLHAVLKDISRVMLKVGFLTIHTGAAQKVLADGRNAHLIQRPRSWWETKLAKYFNVGKVLESGPELYVVIGPKKEKQQKVKARPQEMAHTEG
jgi:uncharacterized Rossmann fold enzyme